MSDAIWTAETRYEIMEHYEKQLAVLRSQLADKDREIAAAKASIAMLEAGFPFHIARAERAEADLATANAEIELRKRMDIADAEGRRVRQDREQELLTALDAAQSALAASIEQGKIFADEAQRLREALEQLMIGISMNWDLDGLVAQARAALQQTAPASAALLGHDIDDRLMKHREALLNLFDQLQKLGEPVHRSATEPAFVHFSLCRQNGTYCRGLRADNSPAVFVVDVTPVDIEVFFRHLQSLLGYALKLRGIVENSIPSA